MPETSEAPVTRAEFEALASRLAAIEAALASEDPVPLDADLAQEIAARRANPEPGIPHSEILREFGL
jgi:hypothetical protein